MGYGLLTFFIAFLLKDKRNLYILRFQGSDASGIHIVLRHKHVEKSERHLEFSGELEVGAVEVHTDPHLRLDVVGIEFEDYIASGRGFLLFS